MSESKEHGEKSFAEQFEESMNFKKPEQGDLLRGTIVSISGASAYIAYGGHTEAIMDASEVTEHQVGDTIEATVVQPSPDMRLSRKMLARKASVQALHQTFESRIPVEGKVTGRNKGGFDVSIGGMRAF